MKYRFVLLLLTAIFLGTPAYAAKPRVIVLTDIENEPDDTQSMIRFLTYSNHWDVEALIATTSVQQREKTAANSIRVLIEAYAKVRDKLVKHEPGYPTAAYLLAVLCEGRPTFGMNAVGPGMDSPGSELIIQVVDRDDPRPVWVTVWGGPNCLAQALWKVRMTRAPVIASGRTGAPFKIEDANKLNAWFSAPKVTKPETLHVILAMTDQGTPALTHYQRMIITIYP